MKVNKKVQFFGRLIASIVVLGITAFFTPGFTLSNLWILIGGILSLTIIDFLIGCFTKLFYHPYIKMIIGFILSFAALYFVQHLIIGYILSIVPIILGAIVYALVDYMLPNEDHDTKSNSKNSTKSNNSKNSNHSNYSKKSENSK